MEKPLVSVAMALYNGERFLEEQLASIAAQTYRPIELVAVDDCSTDATCDLLAAFAQRADFEVRLLRNDANVGPTSTFLRALRETKGHYVAFCDQDDVWLTHKLDACMQFFQRANSSLIVHSCQIVDENLRPQPGRCPDHRRTKLMTGTDEDAFHCHHGMAMVLRGDLRRLASVPPAPSRFGQPMMLHDEAAGFWARLHGSYWLVKDVLGLYRRHGSNVSKLPKAPEIGVTLSDEYARSAQRSNLLRAELLEAWVAYANKIQPLLPEDSNPQPFLKALSLRAARFRERTQDYEGGVPRLSVILRAALRGRYGPPGRGGLGIRSFGADAVRSMRRGRT